jgi:nitroimidazol reductase NimA-like FMN-containing flavoprotein (pyridoxamine 5'-phosphate oxidase superfamily)
MSLHADPDPTPGAPLEALDTEACVRLLSATVFGRLAVVQDGKPVIIVLNHLADGHDLVFRTTPDALISRLTEGRAVHAAYEVDSAFPVGRSGSSVIATGLLARESDPKRLAAARAHITAWADGERDTILRLRVEHLSGRHVGTL